MQARASAIDRLVQEGDLDSISFAAGLYGAARLPPMPAAAGAVAGTRLSAVTAGLAFIRRTPVVAGADAIDARYRTLGADADVERRLNALKELD